MATADQAPIADPHRGACKFRTHLARVLNGDSLESRGWEMPNDLTLFVPIRGGPSADDEYLLRLGFEYYDQWPPTARFVNPKTRDFDPDRDLYWLPRVEGDAGFQVHAAYDNQHYRGQLVCCSVTAEFYTSRHEVRPDQVWDSTRFTFGATLGRAQRALRSEFYKGRFAPQMLDAA